MGAVSIALRIETTVNDVSQFKHSREVQQRDGTVLRKVAPMKTNIYSLHPLSQILKAANRRYLEFISSLDDPSDGAKKLNVFSEFKKVDDRSFKGFNFFSREGQHLFEVLARGEFNIQGLQNKSLRKLFPEYSPASVSRILKRLRVHGLIKKVSGTRKYYLSLLGKTVIALGLKTKETFIIPHLAAALKNLRALRRDRGHIFCGG